MEFHQEPPQHNLGGKVLLKVRHLVANMIFVGAEAAKIWESNEGFHLLQAGTRKSKFHMQGAR